MCRQCVASFSQELQIREATYKQDAYSDYGGGAAEICTACSQSLPPRFVTCSEIWALFMSDDMLYSFLVGKWQVVQTVFGTCGGKPDVS